MSEGGYSRRRFLQTGTGFLGALTFALPPTAGARTEEANGLRISNRYSPFNARRPIRPHTLYLVLHTTEGAENGSLNKVWRLGETHYFVRTNGAVLRIIDRNKIATHAGRSMWEGHSNIDNYSVGIEVVGRHDREINTTQYAALRELIRQLKGIYGIPDERVLTHSMVAYGRPNRFHHSSHRGRKRCGMIFARPDVRLKLGLTAKPLHDVDVEAGRLVVADRQLYRFLFAPAPAAAAEAGTPAVPTPAEPNVITQEYTAWYIARERYNSPDTTYVFPDGRQLQGDQVQDWGRIPVGTRVQMGEEGQEQSAEAFLEIGKDGATARDIAGDAYDRDTTIYFLPDGLIRTGRELRTTPSTRTLLDRLPKGTKVLVGYIYGGYVKTSRSPSSIAGIKWNYPSTFYRFPDGRFISGDEVNDTAIPARTLIFYQN